MRIKTTNLGIIDTERIKRVRIQQKVRQCIQRIMDLFAPFAQKYMSENRGKVNHASLGCWVDANEFLGPMHGEFSTVTISKAKKALGVKTKPIKKYNGVNSKGRKIGAGTIKWVWLYPPRTVNAAIVELGDTRDRLFEENVLRPISQKALDYRCQHNRTVEILRRIMLAHNYCIDSVAVMELAKEEGVSRRSMLRAKRILHVASRRTNGEKRNTWLWVWPAPEVCKWLEEQFYNGKIVENNEVFERAKAKGWNEYLIQQARMVVGGLQITVYQGKICWYDVNFREGFDE